MSIFSEAVGGNWSNWRKPTQAEEENVRRLHVQLSETSLCVSVRAFLCSLLLPFTRVYSELRANRSLHGSLSVQGLHNLPVAHQLEWTPACCDLRRASSNGWMDSRDRASFVAHLKTNMVQHF